MFLYSHWRACHCHLNFLIGKNHASWISERALLFVLEKLKGNGQFKFLQSNLYLSQGKCKMFKQSCMAKHLNFTLHFTINIVFILFILYCHAYTSQHYGNQKLIYINMPLQLMMCCLNPDFTNEPRLRF